MLVRSAFTDDLNRASGESVTACLKGKLWRVRVPRTGSLYPPMEREAGHWCAHLHSRLLPGPFPGVSQIVPALFRRVPPRSSFAISCWKAHSCLVRTVHEDSSSLVTICGHTRCSGQWEPTPLPPAGCANPRSVLLAAFSRHLSRCYPYSFRLPLLYSSCTDGHTSHEETSLSRPCTDRQCTRNRQGRCTRQARNRLIWLKKLYGYMNGRIT